MRAAIAAAMARSNREIPHYHLAHSVDLHHALGQLTAFNARRPVEERVLPAALLLHAIGRVLPRHPDLNGCWSEQGFVPAPGVHLGMAVSLRGGGLVVPALHDADRLDLVEVMAGLRDLVARARAGRLRSSDLADGTVTVTNLGDQGVELVHGIIYPGQAALIGIGRVVERPWAVDGMLAVRPIVQLSLAGDHRASDGHRGALFLTAVDRFLQEVQLP
jgi:pyruvate dehydrogenase E2 component (dihydrolipoamide acetyltransferase)